MAAPGGLHLTVEQRQIQRLAAVLAQEADGKQLRKDLTRNMRAAARPVVVDLKAAIRSAPSQSAHAGQPLRPAIARGVRASVRLTGKNTGVGVVAGKTPRVRGFKNAAKVFNQRSFRHQTFGGNPWVIQVGHPRWWDDTVKNHRDTFGDAVMDSVKDMARRIASR